MLDESVYRSEDSPPAERFDRWRTLVGQTHAPVELISNYRNSFRVFQRTVHLGPVSVWPSLFQPVIFRRTPKLIRESDPQGLHITLPLKGSLYVSRERQEAAYSPHSLNVLDTSHPFEVRAASGADGLHWGVGMEVPSALLPVPRRQRDQLPGLRLSTQEGFGALLLMLLTQLASGTTSYSPADGPRLGNVAVDLLSAMLANALEAPNLLTPESRRQTLVLRIRAFVRQHLHDPDLTPRTIAAAHHISSSYLHRLFQDEEETIAAWIRTQRLEHARRNLADPAMRGTPVHMIAARWGFPRAADFTRAFRTAYGMPPSDYRNQATLQSP